MKSFLERNKSPLTSTITCIVSVFLAIFANHFYRYIIISTDEKQNVHTTRFLFFAIVTFTVIGIFIIAKFSEWIKAIIWPEYKDDLYMKHAFLKIRQLGSKRQKNFQEAEVMTGQIADATFLIQETVQNLQLVVESCYDFFESAFTKTGQLQDSIKFETTFMTKSYIDNEITIPCSANKEQRTPVSMLLRKDDNTIFKNTETAKIYNEGKRKMVLVENTDNDKEYIETYSNQKSRIKSSVILPVKSHENDILGTLVVHCNKPGFFKNSRYDFWNELLELFSVELGYHKLFLDCLIMDNLKCEKPF